MVIYIISKNELVAIISKTIICDPVFLFTTLEYLHALAIATIVANNFILCKSNLLHTL